MGLDARPVADPDILLDFHERPDEDIVAENTIINVGWRNDRHALSGDDVPH
jgi:hypothetical protein